MMRTIRSIADAFRGNPIALALILINVIYVVAGIVLYREDHARYANAIRELIQHCISEDRP